jgi:GPH family glycoside/pentoside/hexuronide:cation symporter
MTDTLGLAAGLASLAILIPKVWVVVGDAIIGVVSDKTETRWGRRRPFILIGGIFAGILFIFLFNIPGVTGQVMLAVYMTIIYLLMNTAFSAFSVPYLTMASEMSDDPDERTTILSIRSSAMALGVMGGALAPKIIGWAGFGRDGYSVMGFILGSLIIASTLWIFFGTAKVQQNKAKDSSIPLKEQIKVALENKPFVILITANIIQYISAGIGYAGLTYYLERIVQVEPFDIMPTFIILMTVFSILTMPTWIYWSTRFGKYKTYVWSLVLFALTTQVWHLAGPERLWPVYIAALCIGYFNTGFILMSYSCLTDTINYDRARTGLSREGALSAVYSATEKASFALGAVVLGLVLSATGYIASESSDVVQPDSALWGIIIGVVILPAALHLVSLLILRRYTLTNEILKSVVQDSA